MAQNTQTPDRGELRQRRAADAPRHFETDSLDGPDRQPASRTPRWVTIALIVVAIMVVVGIVALHATGAMGPGLHGGG